MSMKTVVIAGGLVGALLASAEAMAAEPVVLDVAELDQITAGDLRLVTRFEGANATVRRVSQFRSTIGAQQITNDFTQLVGGVTSFDVLVSQQGGFNYRATSNGNGRLTVGNFSTRTAMIND